MKIIYCMKCHDLLVCGNGHKNKCHCGRSWGEYEADGSNARYGGYAVPLGVCSESLTSAIARQGENRSVYFEAWVWEKLCGEFVKQEPPDAHD